MKIRTFFRLTWFLVWRLFCGLCVVGMLHTIIMWDWAGTVFSRMQPWERAIGIVLGVCIWVINDVAKSDD